MRKLSIFISLLGIFLFHNVSSQSYLADAIPDSLKENAHSVIREFTTELILESSNSGTERIKKVITILDEEGENNSYLVVPFDKSSSVNIKQIVLYNKFGKKIKSAKQSDIEDIPAYSSYELYSEQRLKAYKPIYAEYPYTVEYIYETKSTNLISFGRWTPYSSFNVSVQNSSFTIIYPVSVSIFKKEIRLNIKSTDVISNKHIDRYELNNLKALEDEPLNLSISELIPAVYIMPAKLSYDGYNGNATNWKEYGKWVFSLYKDRDQISQAEKLKVDALLKDIPDTLQRIEKLYGYIQSNTRYVAVTLGIGGYQPFDAKTVFETGYGDCKALTNYMYSLLKQIGVKSYPALVSAGDYRIPLFKDFPNFSQLNHVILCVPFKSDTIWLECTSQKIPFGFLGNFTDDRDVLLISDGGGTFAHTKKYNAEDNRRSSFSEFSIDPEGTATCSQRSIYTGLQYDNLSGVVFSNFEDQKKWLYTNSLLPSLQIKSHLINENRSGLPSVSIKVSAVSKKYCTFSGQNMILSLNLFDQQKPLRKMLKNRYSDILINRSSIDCDTLVFKLPANFDYETLPAGNTINSQFGSYSTVINGSGKEIFFIRRFELKEGRYKADQYKDLYDFILSVSKTDNLKVFLTKKS
jgi:transglutaminase-like putative cysteine protease